MSAAAAADINPAELLELCAIDDELYARTFFPRTCRQPSPPFHRAIDEALNGPHRYVAMMIFRGGAKTTKARLYASKLIAYGLARTIVVVGKSQDHARRSVEWLMKAVDFNKQWSRAFGLRRGVKWTGEEIEVVNEVAGTTVRVLALGITGSTRGINVDDYRPDIIIIDDVEDEENTLTPEQREKTDDFINGALRNSLAPASEAPHAKMIFLQTLLHPDDSISRCARDSRWHFLRFPCFDASGESVWPDRWSTAELRREKESFIARGKLHLWMREMECTIVSNELAAFDPAKLQYWDILPPLEECTVAVGIDPVPPPSEREQVRGLRGKDSEVHAVVLRWRDKFFLADYRVQRGHEPDWSISTFFELKRQWQPRSVRVEGVAYQRTLKWILEKAMTARREWLPINAPAERRNKVYRVTDVIGDLLARRALYVHRSHADFIQQLTEFPQGEHDDILDAVAMAAEEVMQYPSPQDELPLALAAAGDDVPALEHDWRACP